MKKILLLFLFLCTISITEADGAEPLKGYKGYVDFALGDAYNLNTAQLVSTNNMQLYSMISTTHGLFMNKWFIGGGIGYYHSFRGKENMYPVYVAGRYSFLNSKWSPYVETRLGIVYDPLWVSKIQAYGTLGTGIKLYKGLQVGIRLSLFSRPSRYFTANAALLLSYAIGE